MASFYIVACNTFARNVTIPVSGITGRPLVTADNASLLENIIWKKWTKTKSFDPLLQNVSPSVFQKGAIGIALLTITVLDIQVNNLRFEL